jgi:hypothetical protein
MSIAASDLTTFAPELASLTPEQLDRACSSANLQLDAEVWGDWLEMGLLNLAAHLGTLAKRKGTGGAVQSESVGQVSRTYAITSAPAKAALLSTVYGQEYERLAQLLNSSRGPWVC